jgi:hypothetical protein
MQRVKQWFLFLLLAFSGPIWLGVLHAAEPQYLTVQSPPHTVALLEVYTSEGCNSCPPVDDWVSSLSGRGFHSEQVIPLAFHVDYWDYLGWPDRFAQAAFSQRQRAIAAHRGSRTVYTPQLVLQGQDFRSRSSFRETVRQINRVKARADIALQVMPRTKALAVEAQATVTEPGAQQHAVMYVALYENNLSTAVTAGENRGRTLDHNFVVRQWIGPLAPDSQGIMHMQQDLVLERDWKSQDMGLVACVYNLQTGDMLQAVALALQQKSNAP